MSVTTAAITPPPFHLANVSNSPGSTFAGLAAIGAALLQSFSTNGLPATNADLFMIGAVVLSGIAGIFGR